MTKQIYEGLIEKGIRRTEYWLYPFAIGYEQDDDAELTAVTEQLEAIDRQILSGERNGTQRDLTEEERAGLRSADAAVEYVPNIQLSDEFDEDTTRRVLQAHQDGYELARSLSQQSDFSTYTIWERIVRHHVGIESWRQGNTVCTYSYKTMPDRGLVMIIEPFADYSEIGGNRYSYYNEGDPAKLDLVAFLRGFEQYLSDLRDNAVVPLNNTYTRALEIDRAQYVEPTHSIYPNLFSLANRKFFALSAYIQAALNMQEVDPYVYTNAISTLAGRLYRNDAIAGLVEDEKLVGLDSLTKILRHPFDEIDRSIRAMRIDKASGMRLDEVTPVELGSLIRDIFRYGTSTEESILGNWDIQSRDDLDDDDEMTPRRKEILAARDRAIRFLEVHDLSDKYIDGGVVDITRFKPKLPFWDLSTNWETIARGRLIEELTIDLGIAFDILEDDDRECINTGLELLRIYGV